MTDALPLFDRALTVTQADPALTDLRLLLQINKAVTLGDLDRYEEAFAAARQARHLADQVGTVVRLAQAHSALGQLLFDTGRWDDALAEVQVLHEDLKEPGAACCDLGIAAVICFHRGDDHRGAPAPRRRRPVRRADRQPGRRPAGAGPQPGPRARRRAPEALAVLTAGFAGNTEELDEIEDLVADAVRLAAETGDLDTAETLAGHAAALAAGSEIPHRQANALYCRGLLDHDAARLLAAAERYADASRPLLQRQGAGGGRRRVRPRRRPRPGPGRVHRRRGDLHLAGRRHRCRPAAGRLPCPRHPPRPARETPAGPQRLGQPHPDRDQGRRAAWKRACPTRRSPPSCCFPGGPSRPTSPTS